MMILFIFNSNYLYNQNLYIYQTSVSFNGKKKCQTCCDFFMHIFMGTFTAVDRKLLATKIPQVHLK